MREISAKDLLFIADGMDLSRGNRGESFGFLWVAAMSVIGLP
ncbi:MULTISPECIES: hypothetical protein [Achromobacter]|nr:MULTISPECIES: hypothetical protein [Achromobacter]MDH1300532.1 hypothetical protein [Achromobacter sp. GD03932]